MATAHEDLAALAAARADLDDRAAALDDEQRQASENVARLSAALAELERRVAGGEEVPDSERTKLEKQLAAARARSAEPWQERRDGLRAAIRDADHKARAFVAEHLDELLGELREEAEASASAVDRACRALIAAYHERQAVDSRVSALLAMVRSPRPGDVRGTAAEAVFRAAEHLLQEGGERAPLVTVDPREPRHGATPKVHAPA